MRSDMSSQQSLASSSSSSSGMMADIEGGYRRPRRESEPGLYSSSLDYKKQGWLLSTYFKNRCRHILKPASYTLVIAYFGCSVKCFLKNKSYNKSTKDYYYYVHVHF